MTKLRVNGRARSSASLLYALSIAALVSTGTVFAAEWPALGPLGPVKAPADNPTTAAKVELGKLLFFDGRLSGDGSFGCIVCHLPVLGWGTGTAISFGYPGTQHWRNSQTIYNAAYYNKLFWEGNQTSLESQAKAAATGAVAGNGDTSMMEMKLRLVPEYVTRFRQVFGTDWPHINDAWRAIAAFQRTLVSDPGEVPFDRYMAGDTKALSKPARRGMTLFEGKARCITCHNGPLISDQRFYNLGVPENAVFQSDPIYQITLRWELYQKGMSEAEYRKGDRDLGLYHVSKIPGDKAKFRTPSLRELNYTAPYMHNGTLATLEDVVNFYDRGGGPSTAKVLTPLQLSAPEKDDLVTFLKSLSMDKPILMDPPKLPETKPLPWGG